MILNFERLSSAECYFAMVQAIIPRPIAWVLTDNGKPDGIDGVNGKARFNLAPFSFFTGVCSDPPLLMISVGKKSDGDEIGQLKDTRRNIAQHKKFVVHIASSDLLDPLNESAVTLNYGVSEVELLGLATEPFDDFELPRLTVCSIAMACTLYKLDELGNTPQALIYGEIHKMYINEVVLDLSRPQRLIIDPQKLNPLARLGGGLYTRLGELLIAPRPK
jgi:flavin reductase (DIM6/NTAB) family NADH-FMN oxidoreductase RutF